MKKASFYIDDYVFDKVYINLENQTTDEIIIDFDPTGTFNSKDSQYKLTFKFTAKSKDDDKIEPFVSINCTGTFIFENVSKLDEIPPYFYRNGIAILFPYLRAFISIVTTQTNMPKPMMLPTLNLVALEIPLKENTIEL